MPQENEKVVDEEEEEKRWPDFPLTFLHLRHQCILQHQGENGQGFYIGLYCAQNYAFIFYFLGISHFLIRRKNKPAYLLFKKLESDL